MAGRVFGEYFKKLRSRTGLTLRAFCEQHGFDPGNMSRLERGLLPPPQGEEKLKEYAEALKLKPGSDEWYEFFDRAAAAGGRLPKEMLSDEEVVERLPILFRTLRGEPVDARTLAALVILIRRA